MTERNGFVSDHYYEPFGVGSGATPSCIHCGKGSEVHHYVR